MKHIAVFCDGTWNNKDRTDAPTSVARMFTALQAEMAQGRKDVLPIYIEGVGATNNLGGLRRVVDKIRGGTLGRGLTRNIARAFREIARAYEPDDQIYIFGFSRGAYTARSLAGLIRAAGLPKIARNRSRGLRWYRDPSERTHPRSHDSLRLRAEISPDFYTSDTERDWRIVNGFDPGAPIRLAYLGIFDTVGANGIPGVLGQLGLVPGGHGFHDHDLSSMVRAGRHAVAIDERRVLYRPTLWSNLPELNRKAGRFPTDDALYQQVWFPGVHGKIGGSGEERRISNSVLAWVLQGAKDAGLEIALPPELRAQEDDFKGMLDNGGGFDPTALIKRARKGPGLDDRDQLHRVAVDRLLFVPDYRPKALKALLRMAGWRATLEADRGPTRRA